MEINENEVRNFYDYFKHICPTEIRVFDEEKYPNGKSVFVENEDEFVKQIKQFNETESIDVYIGGRDRKTKGDDNVISSHQIFLEIDEHDTKKPEELPKLKKFLEDNNIKIGMLGMSGGGYHIYIPHELTNLIYKEDREKYKQFLLRIRSILQNNNLDIDNKVFNLERVSRVLGSFNHKRNKQSEIIEINIVNLKENTEAIKLLLDKYPDTQKELEIDIGTALEILKKYKIHESEDKWIYELIDKKIIIKEDTGGNSIVFKNGAIIVKKYNLSDSEINIIGIALSELCRGRTLSAFQGHIRLVEKNKLSKIYVNEFNKWIRTYQYPLTEYKLTEKEHRENIEYKEQKKIIYEGAGTFFSRKKNKEGKVVIGSFIPQKMGNYLLQNNSYKTLKDNDKIIYVYRNGVYNKEGISEIKKDTTNYLSSLYKEHYVNETLSYIRNKTYISTEEINHNWINFKNGLFNPLTNEFKEHTPKIFSLIQLPISYDETAKCPLWIEELKKKCDEDWKYDLIQEMFGYCFLPDSRFEKAFLFYGDNQTMKSTVLNTLAQLIGEKNIVALSLQQLTEDKHCPADLFGKPVNICADLSSRELRYDAMFLKITGRDPITAGKKFEQEITFIPITKLFFSCNTIPGTTNKNLAFYRRWCLIEFNIKHEKKDTSMREKLKQELPGILNWAMEGLARLLKNNNLSYPLSSEETRDLYEQNSNTIQSYIFNNIDCEDDEGVIKKRDVYKDYIEFCKKNKLTPSNQVKFGRIFFAITGCGSKRIGTIPGYAGVSFKGSKSQNKLNLEGND